MKENPNCQLCLLHETCNPRSVCLKGEGGDKPKLLIYNNAPTTVEDKRHRAFVSEGSDLLRWLIRRMSVNYKDVYFDYVLKCYPKANKRFGKKPDRLEMIQACFKYRLATLQALKPKVVVAMGATACEAFLGSDKVSQFEGTKWSPQEAPVREVVKNIWVTYAPDYAIQSPAECVTIYRTLFAAAEEAGLEPKYNDKERNFDFGI